MFLIPKCSMLGLKTYWEIIINSVVWIQMSISERKQATPQAEEILRAVNLT
jgi:hypothetical protein